MIETHLSNKCTIKMCQQISQFHYLKVRNQDEKHQILYGCQYQAVLKTRFKCKMPKSTRAKVN